MQQERRRDIMPMKLNVGISRKVGEPNYGSRGASINLELEVDQSLIEQPARLKQRIEKLFALARAAVADELAACRPNPSDADTHRRQHATAAQYPARAGLPADTSPAADNGRSQTERPATASQLRALRSIAARRGLDLATIVRGEFGCTPSQLSLPQASWLIDHLKAAR